MGSIVYLLVFLVSAATLALQIALTRVFALAQGYHFAFMSISIALLGFGASGSLLYLAPRPRIEHRGVAIGGAGPTPTLSPEKRENLNSQFPALSSAISVATLLFGGTAAAAYLGANALPLDLYLLGVDPRQWAYLIGYFALLSLPFLFAGAAVGLAISSKPAGAGVTYFASLAGSAAGAAGGPWLLNGLAPGGVVMVVAAALAAGATLVALRQRSLLLVPGVALAVALGVLLLAPDLLEVRTSPYRALNQALLYPSSRVVWRGQNAFSQVDLLESRGIRSAPGLSLAYQGRLPQQHGVATDLDNLSPVLPLRPGENDFTRYLPGAAAYRLLALPYSPSPDPPFSPSVLVLEPGGGLEVVAALEQGAGKVTVVAANPEQVEAVRQVKDSYLEDPRVRLVEEGARSFLASARPEFDLIVLPLAESFRVVTAGAFSVSESYLLTVESIAAQYRLLKPGGFLVLHRWLQQPPSEELRALLLVAEALELSGAERPAHSVAAFRSFQTATLLVKRGELRPEEMAELRAFAAEMSYDLIHLPGLGAAEANRFNLLPQDPYFETFALALSRGGRRELLDRYPFDVRASTDDRPFFFHFFRMSQLPEVIRNLGRSWQPFGGSGYLVMFALLAFALTASATLILVPLAIKRNAEGGVRSAEARAPRTMTFALGRMLILLYFAGLGVGYLFLELPLLQRMILFLDQPTYSFAAVLFALLLFSGLGSLAVERLRWPLPAVLVALGIAAPLYGLLLPRLLSPFLGQPLALRFLLALAALAPLAFLMGMPFPRGVALLGAMQPRLVPWAWGINGCASVVSSVLASMIALAWGFTAVVTLAGAAYGLSALTVAALSPSPRRRSLGRTSPP